MKGMVSRDFRGSTSLRSVLSDYRINELYEHDTNLSTCSLFL